MFQNCLTEHKDNKLINENKKKFDKIIEEAQKIRQKYEKQFKR